MTLRQCQVLEALLAVEEGRPGGRVGFGAHPDEVRYELAPFRPARVSSEMIRRELRAMPTLVRERAGRRGRKVYTLTEAGRVKARELAAARARLRREAAARSSRNRQARELEL